MKCRKCGREVDSRRTFCPACGTRLYAGPDMEELTNEIAGKVDLFMNEDEAYAGENEEGKTITRMPGSDAEYESVFDDISGGLSDEDYTDDTQTEYDLYGEDLNRARAESHLEHSEDYDEPEHRNRRPSGKKKKSNTGLIIGIIAAAVVIVGLVIALLFVSGVLGGKEEETEATTIADVITCSAEEGGSYSAPLEITLISDLSYRIYYTLDGSTPSSSSDLYSGTITLDESYIGEDDTEAEITLRAVSYTENSIKSAEFEITFTLTYSEVDAPDISPSSGSYDEACVISITAVSGAEIYYTTDGTTPTENSTLYTGEFEMERGNTVISAIAVKNGISSSVTTAVYNLDIPSKYTFDEAADIILLALISDGEVADEDGNLPADESETTEEETEEEETEEEETVSTGYVDFMDGGTCVIDSSQYLVVLCYFYDSLGNVTESRIYGVEDQEGTYVELTETSSGYEIK